MKLETDDEAIALHRLAERNGISVERALYIANFGYRMGLERAARKCEEFAGARTNGHQCAAAIREMAHD